MDGAAIGRKPDQLDEVARATSLDTQSVTFNGVGDPNDSLSNAPSTVMSGLSNPLTYSFAPYSVTLLRLGVDEVPPQISVADTAVTEGNSGAMISTILASVQIRDRKSTRLNSSH